MGLVQREERFVLPHYASLHITRHPSVLGNILVCFSMGSPILAKMYNSAQLLPLLLGLHNRVKCACVCWCTGNGAIVVYTLRYEPGDLGLIPGHG